MSSTSWERGGPGTGPWCLRLFLSLTSVLRHSPCLQQSSSFLMASRSRHSARSSVSLSSWQLLARRLGDSVGVTVLFLTLPVSSPPVLGLALSPGAELGAHPKSGFLPVAPSHLHTPIHLQPGALVRGPHHPPGSSPQRTSVSAPSVSPPFSISSARGTLPSPPTELSRLPGARVPCVV